MKKSLKFLAGFFAFAVIFTMLGTRNSIFETVYADSDVAYTGTLSQFLTQEKNAVNTTLDATYARVYDRFENSGLNLMKTLNYQSLICLGVMKEDTSLLTIMQKDNQELKLSFLKDFLALEAEIATLEEKNRIQQTTTISMFTYGTSYESEKARIAEKIVQTKALHLGFIRNFENTHMLKLQDFITTVMDYSRQNTGVMNYVNDKIRKIQSIEESFATLTSGVNQINALAIGGGTDFLANAGSIRTGFVNGLATRLQALIDSAKKTHKKLPTLGDALMNEKDFAIRNYGLDFDEKMNDIMNQRYNKADYKDIKESIEKLKADFMTQGKLNCTKIYASQTIFDAKVNTLLNKVNDAMSGFDNSLKNANTAGFSQQAKTSLLAGFAEFNKQNLNKKILEFKKIIRDKASKLAKTSTTTMTTTETTTTDQASVEAIENTSSLIGSVNFTRPFKKGETGTAIKNLQILLKNNGYYNGEINGIYTTQTIQGVYQFQLKNGLLRGYERRPATRGWMGPATRAKLNELANK